MAPPLPEGAERASRKGIGAPDRQRHGQGHRPGVRLVGDAGERHSCDHREIAAAEKINASYVGRVLGSPLPAPDIVEGALNGRLSPEFTLERAMKPVPTVWEDQRLVLRV
jgi:hypothetical protein